MAEFVDRQRKNRERNRPAVNFTQRDDVREFAGSGIGRNYNRMMDLQSQKNPNLDQLKQARRQWNRYDKYNAGEMLGKTPQQMQNEYMGISRDLRQSNKPAYNKMYPISGGIMDVGEKGGILGTILSEIGKMGKDKGIVTNVDDSVEDQEEYVAKTFGPINIHDEEFIDTENWDERDVTIPPDYPIDEGAFTSLNPFDDSRREAAIMAQYPGKEIEEVTEEYAGPWPHADMPYLSDEAAAIQKEFNTNPYFQNLQDPNVVLPFEKDRRGHPHLETYTPDAAPRLGTESPHDFSETIRVDPKYERWLTDTSDNESGLEADVSLPTQEPLPFDDSGRESGIASMMKSGLNLAGRRPYEDVYRAFVESSGPSEVMVTYEDFMENYLPRIQESRGVFRAGLNSQGRR